MRGYTIQDAGGFVKMLATASPFPKPEEVFEELRELGVVPQESIMADFSASRERGGDIVVTLRWVMDLDPNAMQLPKKTKGE